MLGKRGAMREFRIAAAIAVATLVAASAAAAVRAGGVPTTSVQPKAPRPLVVELFTSEGCSSCPPADALLRELSRTRADILALAFHVTYWNALGWRDPFSLDAATERQRDYAISLPSEVYTPELVIDGRNGVVGSDVPAAASAIGRAVAGIGPSVSVSVRRTGPTALIQIGGAAGSGRVLLVGYDPEHTTPVGRGENVGRTLVEADVVRSFGSVAAWTGAPITLERPLPAGERLAVLVQASDGSFLGAAREATDVR